MNVTSRIPALPLNIFLAHPQYLLSPPCSNTGSLLPPLHSSYIDWPGGSICRRVSCRNCEAFFSQHFVFFPVAWCFDSDVMAARGGVSFFEFLVCVFSP